MHHHNLGEHLLVPPKTEIAALLPRKNLRPDPCPIPLCPKRHGSRGSAHGPIASSSSQNHPDDIDVVIEDGTESKPNRRNGNFTAESETETTGNARLVEDEVRPNRSLVSFFFLFSSHKCNHVS